MNSAVPFTATESVETIEALGSHADFSLMQRLNRDPQARPDGKDHEPRQVFSGHYVPVQPTPLPDAELAAVSPSFFKELGLSEKLAERIEFQQLFTGELHSLPGKFSKTGWATGYALSIYGTEYTQQCPFQTGNGYGDGRAISVLEAVLNGQRWEFQLKGGGPTPYCRGGDGRAVLRSSVREFLAQEHMHALGIPTSRSLSLFVSKSEKIRRPWYTQGSHSFNPDQMGWEPSAISTRVAPSFLRVGQVELFARRVRAESHPQARAELELILSHVIEREYAQEIDLQLPKKQQWVRLAELFRARLCFLVAQWIRVGYCQGNFNSDNCALGGFTLDYGPFGFCDLFDPSYQPWTGGGEHFSFFNQPAAAEKNFHMFWKALQVLYTDDDPERLELDRIHDEFGLVMQEQLNQVWAAKLGLEQFAPELVTQLIQLMHRTGVDYTLLFRALSELPDSVDALRTSFYPLEHKPEELEKIEQLWSTWFDGWRSAIDARIRAGHQTCDEIRSQMKQVNPKFIWREWMVVPAYQHAAQGDYQLIHELMELFTEPYAERTKDLEKQYFRQTPVAYLNLGGVSHYSCSS